MISRGAHILPEEIEPLTAYLAANYGPNSPPPSSPTQASGGSRSASGQQLPEAEGKSILLRSCQQCHGLETITEKTGSKEDWSEIINRMVSYGVELSPAEQGKLAEYLSGLAPSR
ncbi:MAG: hypothetical protein HY647_01475 [Acidobacteria bacterium]|nr:hypothetical protein [Acidobacteriota bacterium]